MFKSYKKFKNQKLNDVRRELSRAHLIIALLAFVAIVLLVQQSALYPDINTIFTTIAIVLLAVLATISLTIALILRSLRK